MPYTNYRKCFDLPGQGVEPTAIRRAIGLQLENVVCEYYAGITENEALVNIGYGDGYRNLAVTGSPTRSTINWFDRNSNKLQAYSYSGTGQYHSVAYDIWQEIFASDFSMSFVCQPAAANKGIFRKSDTVAGAGISCSVNASGYFIAVLWKAGPLSVTVTGPATSIVDGYPHLIQIVRSSNTCTITVDGTAGTPVDVSGYGTATSSTLMQLGSNGLTAYQGNISYFRIVNVALSATQLSKEQALWKGIYAGPTRDTLMTFSRTSQAYQRTPDGWLYLTPAGWPRTADGLQLEATSTNYCLQSQTFQTTWATTGATITTDTADTLAPDGTQTADILVNNGVGTSHVVYQSIAWAAGVAMGSVYIKPGNKKYAYLQLSDGGASVGAYFNLLTGQMGTTTSTYYGIEPLANGWFRCWIGHSLGTGSSFSIYAADSTSSVTYAGALSDKELYLWGGQLETGVYTPTSYIPTTTGSVARNTDSLRIASAGILPSVIAHDYLNKKIRVVGEYKATAATLAASAFILCEISGSTGTAGNLRNRLIIYAYTSILRAYLYEDQDTTGRYFDITVTGGQNKWHKFDVMFDLSDLNNSDAYVDGVAMTKANLSGITNKEFKTYDTSIRIAQAYDGQCAYGVKVKNVQVMVV